MLGYLPTGTVGTVPYPSVPAPTFSKIPRYRPHLGTQLYLESRYNWYLHILPGTVPTFRSGTGIDTLQQFMDPNPDMDPRYLSV